MSVSINASELRREMARRGWDAIDLARAARLSPATVSAALAGKPISAKSVALIAQAIIRAPTNELLDRLVTADNPDLRSA
jgi:transcriptional regulator with XRE-family HTH domain